VGYYVVLSRILQVNFYEKALFVKVDVATALWLKQLLCPSRYASIRTFRELTFSLVARCIMGSVFSGYQGGAAIFRAAFPEGGPSSQLRSHLTLDPKRYLG
jgi:hypothetical protein